MVKIIGDTTSGLPQSTAQAYDIPIIPQIITVGGKSYLEGAEITYESFLEKLSASDDPPTTSAPPPELFLKEFYRLAPTGESILCILPSAKVSGTVQSAHTALQTMKDCHVRVPDVRIIDTGVISSPVAVLLQLAGAWAAQGLDADTIEAQVREMCRRCKVYFLVDTLKYLARGGRIGGASALLGDVLQVKPILTFKDGQVDLFESVRTYKRATRRLQDLVVEEISRDAGHLTVLQAAVPADAQKLAHVMEQQLNLSDVPIFNMPPAVVTHGGPGILGVGFFTPQ